jgi:hypothetical protein
MIVDEKEGLKEFREQQNPLQPAFIRTIATIVSYVFHPIFIPVYLVFFMLYVHPYLFAGVDAISKTRVMIMSTVMYSFFPLVTVLLLKALDFINSFKLSTQRDRVIPLLACMIWYGWVAYVWYHQAEYPVEAVQMAAGIFFCSILGMFGNIVMKISLHAISVGLALTFILQLAFAQSIHFGAYVSIAAVVTGMVCTSRFIVSDHNAKEIYGGLITGAASLLLGEGLVNLLQG